MGCRSGNAASAASTAVYQPAEVVASAEPLASLTTVAAAEATPAGPIVRLNAEMSTRALQTQLSRAPRGATVLFAAGTYKVDTTITVPCNDLHLTGPEGKTPTAILSASYTNSDILAFAGGCDHLGSIKYLHFDGTGGVYSGIGDNGNFVFDHNVVTGLPSGLSNGSAESGLFFDGNLSTKLRNVMITNNSFGDANSCVAVFATVKDEGGACSGIITSQGADINLTIAHNNFFHVENGIHLNQMAQYSPGHLNSICVSCRIEYNYIANFHRIGIEVQLSTPTDSILVEHNAVIDPVNSSWGTFGVSMACCQWTETFTTPGFSPGYIFNDNVLIATLPIGSGCPPYGVEFWGTGPQGINSLIQGTFCHGYTWGYGAAPWAIRHNYICGPNYSKGGYITNQQHQDNAPAQSDNITDSRCLPTASTPPSFKQAGGNFSGSQKIEIFDKGVNTGIWYTTDGSTPVPGAGTSQRYSEPFIITTTTTVRAVGMWGAPNQPLSYPAGFGYVPSSVTSASFVLAAGAGSTPPKR